MSVCGFSEITLGIQVRLNSYNESVRDAALNDERMTATELKWYSDIKAEMRKDGIPVDDISKLQKQLTK